MDCESLSRGLPVMLALLLCTPVAVAWALEGVQRKRCRWLREPTGSGMSRAVPKPPIGRRPPIAACCGRSCAGGRLRSGL